MECSHWRLTASVYPPDFHGIIVLTRIITVTVAAFNITVSFQRHHKVSLTGARCNQWQRRMTAVNTNKQ